MPHARQSRLFRRLIHAVVWTCVIGNQGAGAFGESTITATWQGIDLRQAADRLAQSQRLCVWLDRRVDPSTPIAITATNSTLGEVLDQLTEQADAGWVREGDLIYVGPTESVREFRTLLAIAREQNKQVTPGVRKQIERRVVMDIPRLAEPRRLVEQLAEQAGVRVENLDAVPHDLWPRKELPAMTVGEHLALVLVGFDLGWRPETQSKSIRLVPIERPVMLEKTYDRRQLAAAPDSDAKTAALAKAGSAARVTIAATAEEHDALRGRTGSPRPEPKKLAAGKQVYSLRAQDQPAGAVLEQLAKQLGKKLDASDEVRQSDRWTQRVSFEVQEADLAELIEAIAKPAGLSAQVTDDAIHVE
jgi:hypothetical protein